MKLPAYFTGFSSKSDGSASLRFATQELTAQDFAGFKGEHNAFGWLIFSPNEGEQIPDESAEEEGITPSERLRRVMYVYFRENVKEGDFDTWRRQKMEAIIDKFKEGLPKR